MPFGRYRFARDHDNVAGNASKNSPSTDALAALLTWRHQRVGREFTKELDECEFLEAFLTWADDDDLAGPDLDGQCEARGVKRILEGT